MSEKLDGSYYAEGRVVWKGARSTVRRWRTE